MISNMVIWIRNVRFSFIHSNSYLIIDYPYGTFINGSTFGASHLITSQPATYSLFSVTAGFYLYLSQSDYMSIISLVFH